MNIDTKFLLVCLQLIIISLMSLRVEGREGGSQPFAHMNGLLDRIPPGPTTSRAYRLFSRCTFKHVLVQDKVSATGNNTDFKGEIELQTVMARGRVKTRILGLYADRYICFNRRGRLVTKPRKKAKGAKCEFVEQIKYDGYSQFRSAKNEDWLLGFNRTTGKPLLSTSERDNQLTEDQYCFDFLKVNPKYRSIRNHQGKLVKYSTRRLLSSSSYNSYNN